VVLAGGGIVAFVLGGHAHDDAVQQCAQVVSSSLDACDSKKSLVRGWDAAAATAWIAAAGATAFAVVLWARAPSTSAGAGLVVGPSSVGLRGTF
jgi:CHASE2 domain-containing sensor protein